jgi:hypothetical protein
VQEQLDIEPDPQDAEHQIVTVQAETDPTSMIRIMEDKAKYAGRMRVAREHLIVSETYSEDWTIQGEGDKAKACLSSAGAERIGRNFPIAYHDVKFKKEEWEDALGKAYRYVYTGYADMNASTVFAEGRYGTRDKFLGYAHGEWKSLEDINENSIRSAAYHVFVGNTIKALLGLRGIPAKEYSRIMAGTGRDPGKSSNVERGKGTQGGTDPDDTRHQRELTEICIAIADSAQTVEFDGKEWHLVGLSEADSRESMEIAQDVCVRLSGFTDKEGKEVKGKLSKQLRGKWLNATLAKARKLNEQLSSSTSGGDGFPGE